ncbi:MAG TPA: DUF72 domain-containing protein, partial [Myxococcaceae bacterium]|nr:DUF72 domain-containing protein [Myxococcaceae bacterium]
SAWRHLPPLPQQAWKMRARAGSALVVRWMLPPELGYEEARELYWPFDRLVNENPTVRNEIADLAVEAISQGRPAYVSINNKAEGSAPVSVERLAVAIRSRLESGARR